MAIELTLLNPIQLTGDSYAVEWYFTASGVDLNTHTINLYRAEASNALTDQWELIGSGLSFNDSGYIDATLSGLYSFNRDWYYQIEVLDADSLQVLRGPTPPALANRVIPDKNSKYIKKLKKKSLDFIGRTFTLYKKRTWGVKCEIGWDEMLQKPTGRKCEGCTCFSSGWYDAYFTGLEIKGMINNSPKLTQIVLFGEFMPSDVMFSTLDYPALSPGDVLKDSTGKRWWVQQVRPVTRLGVPLEQVAQLSLIHPDDELYTL